MTKIETYQKKLDKRFPDEKLLALEYTNCKKPSKVQCLTCGKVFAFAFAEGSYCKSKKSLCKECGEAAERKKRFEKKIKETYIYDDIEIVSFTDNNSQCVLKCKKCGTKHEYKKAKYSYNQTTTPYFCHNCVPHKKEQRDKTILKFLEYVNNIENGWLLNDDMSRIKNFQKDKIKCICAKCGKINNRVVYDYLYGVKCSCSSPTAHKDNIIFKQCLEDGYELISDYTNIYGKVLIKHKCGFCYSVTARACWQGNGKCPKCHKKHSKGEKIIQRLLEKNNISYAREYPLKIENHTLRFDFYLPSIDKYIEYNGIQHYQPIEHFGGVSQLKKQQYYDKLKKQFLKDKLIIIRYDEDIEKSFIEKILKFND